MKVVLIDGNNQAHKAYHAYKNLTYNGSSVSAIYGFICMLRAVMNSHRPDKVVISWDHARNKARMEAHQEYKANRNSADKEPSYRIDREDFNRQVAILMGMVHNLGIQQLYGDNMEGDDYLYWAYKKLSPKAKSLIVVSSDKDFNQMLVDKKVSIYDTTKQRRYYKENLKSHFGYNPEQTISWLTLMGDTSDNIPGYRGIGKVGAAKFLEQFNTIQNFLNTGDAVFKGIDRKVLLELSQKNQLLIDLEYFFQNFIKPHHKLVFFKTQTPKKLRLRKEEFYAQARKLNFISFIKYEFLKPFEEYYSKQ